MSSFTRRPGDTKAWWIQEPPPVAQRQAFTQYKPTSKHYPPLKEKEEEEEEEEEVSIVKDIVAREDAAVFREEEGIPFSSTSNGSWSQRIFRNRKFWMAFGLTAMLLTFLLVLVLKITIQKATVHSIRPLAGEEAQSATPLVASPAAASGNRTSRATLSTTTFLSNRVACPASHGNLYKAADGTPFRIICDDGAGAGAGVVAASSEATASFESCLDVCAQDASCCGAGWGPAPESGALTCWKKRRVRVGGPGEQAKGTTTTTKTKTTKTTTTPTMMIFGEREMLL